MEKLLFAADPVGINYEENTDEYAPEVSRILPRLAACKSAEDVTEAVYSVFVDMFDPITAGPKRNYEVVSREIWRRWREHIGAINED